MDDLIDISHEVKTTKRVLFEFAKGDSVRLETDDPEALINKCVQDGGIWEEKSVGSMDILKSERTFYPISSLTKILIMEYYDEVRPFLAEWYRKKYGRDPAPDATDDGLWSSWEAEMWTKAQEMKK